ncbi:MAG: 1-acyl-sn-glycerol-3-phosphate acyltransferase [Prevotella sp.]
MNKYDDIRPYYDEEIPAAMRRIAESEFFPLLSSYVYPNVALEEVRAKLCSFTNIRDFQLEVMRCVNEQVIRRSITEFTSCGIERLDPSRRYLFVSNHRDIMLDSSLLQYQLYKNGHETTEITFGANLMCNELVIDIGKSNKMFRVERGGNIRDFYKSSLHLSEYIRHVITEKKQSVWIAQRNGRTKDGNDLTDQGIVKMFCMSRTDNKIDAIDQLSIVPVAVSYEWESCDFLKALELYTSRDGTRYIKRPGEDLNSILTGIVQYKGRVHLEFCKPLERAELLQFDKNTQNEYHKLVARLIDERIVSSYRLFPNNYIAHDMRYGQDLYADKYTTEQRDAFIDHMHKLDAYVNEGVDMDQLYDIFLGIYSNPVKIMSNES